ncbi:cheilanthifoline synthase-like [Cryptomeria japonica]|uniref:cheilanthifoline synthase-like n=1 Tax=Cryptomeria japonica TaxID=3369 RepID=UPI0027DA34D5|nr:cheilanthifoline synthase-like [Cryptomeria japonica]
MGQTLAVVNYLPTVQGTFIFLVAASLISTFVALAFLLSSTKERKWPPSPPRLPLLGNFHQLNKSENILSSMTDMAKTYGPVMTVWMGPSPLIVLTGQASIWEALVKEMRQKKGVVRPFDALKIMAMNFIAHLCFGLDFQDENFLSKLEEFIAEDISLSKRGDMFLESFSLARFFVPSSIRTERKWNYREYFKRSAPSSFLNCLVSIDEGEEGEDKSKLSDEEIAFNLHELFLPAVDSTSTAIEWALAYLITNPHVQEKAHQEISQAAGNGNDGYYSLEDLRKLPYVQSVVKETLRKESIAPLGMIHQTENECKVMDITIPAKSRVHFNLHSVNNDPEVWKEPEKLRPERFLGNNEVRMAYLPFGTGRRVCAGMDVASVYVPITLASLLKSFEWGCAKEGSLPDLARDIQNVLMSMKYPLEARITPRPS